MNDLALQIAEIHRVVVAQGQPSDTAGGEIQRGRRTEPAQTDDEHFCIEQALLPLNADLRQQDVPAIAQQLLVVHAGSLQLFKNQRATTREKLLVAAAINRRCRTFLFFLQCSLSRHDATANSGRCAAPSSLPPGWSASGRLRPDATGHASLRRGRRTGRYKVCRR